MCKSMTLNKGIIIKYQNYDNTLVLDFKQSKGVVVSTFSLYYRFLVI